MNESIHHLYLISKSLKSKEDSLEISSGQLGHLLGVSQQSASRYLMKLDRQGYIKRLRTKKGQEIRLTEKGVDELEMLHEDLTKFLSTEAKKEKIEGYLSRGIGEGAYYIKEYSEEIKKRLGFIPFPGTFNVKIAGDVQDELDLERLATGTIKGFRKEGRSFGPIKYAQVRLTANGKEEDCYLIVPLRTHHKDVLEIISPDNLRQKLDAEENEKITVEFT